MSVVNVLDVPQGSPEWFAARCGRLTGSAAADMMATIKTGEAAARRDLRTRLIVERLTGQTDDDGYVSKEMQRGTEKEPEARAAYEAETGLIVQTSGFLSHAELMTGCSLDGHVGEFEGIVELKCPKSATHLRYLLAGVLPKEHAWQVTHNLWVSGAQWADFVSFDDRWPYDMQLFRVRVTRDQFDLTAYELLVRQFLSEVDLELEKVAKLRSAA